MAKNEQAFPCPMGPDFPECDRGMTMRQWFAGQALTGLLANPNVLGHSARAGFELVNCTPAQLADYAMHFGDQMVFMSNQPREVQP